MKQIKVDLQQQAFEFEANKVVFLENKSVQIVIEDPNNDMILPLYNWCTKIFAIHESQPPAEEYKAKVTIKDEAILIGTWLQGVNWGQLDFGSDIVTIEIILHYDQMEKI